MTDTDEVMMETGGKLVMSAGVGTVRRVSAIALMVLLLGCAKTTYDAYPEGWPVITTEGRACDAVVGTYIISGSTNNPDRPNASLRDLFLGERVAAPTRYDIAVGEPDMIRLSFGPTKNLIVEEIWTGVEPEYVVWTTTLSNGEDGYRCDENGMVVPGWPMMAVAGYNSQYRVVTRAADGSLIGRSTTSAFGVWIFPPLPMAGNSTTWYRFEAAQ